jgi:formylglycine-generating enzyme required for sulfatase activity
VGLYPSDESVYGIEDLAGSMSELVLDIVLHSKIPRLAWIEWVTIRGANWTTTNALDVHAASRNRRLPFTRSIDVGIRLVAELPR